MTTTEPRSNGAHSPAAERELERIRNLDRPCTGLDRIGRAFDYEVADALAALGTVVDGLDDEQAPLALTLRCIRDRLAAGRSEIDKGLMEARRESSAEDALYHVHTAANCIENAVKVLERPRASEGSPDIAEPTLDYHVGYLAGVRQCIELTHGDARKALQELLRDCEQEDVPETAVQEPSRGLGEISQDLADRMEWMSGILECLLDSATDHHERAASAIRHHLEEAQELHQELHTLAYRLGGAS